MCFFQKKAKKSQKICIFLNKSVITGVSTSNNAEREMEDGTPTDTEKQLLDLLASLKAEATPEADFESRFLYDFHERVARETVCCPAHRRMWEHILQIFANFGRRGWAYGASTLGVGALAVGYIALPEENAAMADAQPHHSRFERAVNSMAPALARECASCTSCMKQEKDEFALRSATELAQNTMPAPVAYRAEIEDYTSSAPMERDMWSVQPGRGSELFFSAPAF